MCVSVFGRVSPGCQTSSVCERGRVRALVRVSVCLRVRVYRDITRPLTEDIGVNARKHTHAGIQAHVLNDSVKILLMIIQLVHHVLKES